MSEKKRNFLKFIKSGTYTDKSGNRTNTDKAASRVKKIDLDLVGLMCIPPSAIDPEGYFEEMNKINKALGFVELSMGMSSDFLKATKHLSTYVRVGSRIFGSRS